MSINARQVQLIRRPEGKPSPSDFRIVEAALPDLAEGELLVENLWMSVDPYMRRNMDADAKDLEPWPLNAPLDGPCVGRVIASRNPGFDEGDIVESLSGWQTHFISDGSAFVPYLTASNSVVRRTHDAAAPRDYAGLLGMASMTAYAGMRCLAEFEPGETVVVSSGAGTVGSLACQIARIRGARVVASAGTDEKVAWLKEELGVAEAFNYRSAPMAESLQRLCPNGIDLVLENASPEHLSACLPLMNELKTILICGFVSIYSTGGKVPPFENFEFVLDRFLTIKCFRFMDSLHRYDEFVSEMLEWRDAGALRFRETIHNGIESAPEAFCSLFGHDVSGKVLVNLGETVG
jgi:NADPH-dependent curcumin reductase CurA